MEKNDHQIIFDIKYTSPKASDRAFYDMTGEKNVFSYITTESKRIGRKASKKQKFTLYEYLLKSTGVFDEHGTLSPEQVAEMKERAKNNNGYIWHGFVSLNKKDSARIDTPDKCIAVIRRTMPSFLREAGFKRENIDLMCSLHKDKPHHLHWHFVFWEKEPKYKGKEGKPEYRRRGKISGGAIDNMFVRLGLIVRGNKDGVHKARDNAIRRLKELTCVKNSMHSTEEIKEEILSLVKDLPKSGRLQYESKDMEPFRGRIDKIVRMLIDYDPKARQTNIKFYEELEKRKREISEICGNEQVLAQTGGKLEGITENLPKYKHKIDESKIDIVQKLEADFKRRQGNLVLGLCKFIKPEFFERKKGKRYKTNDDKLKRRLAKSQGCIKQRFRKFFSTLGSEFGMMERDFTHRLQDIEKEMEQEREQREAQAHQNYNKEGNKKE